ncbi:MAG: Ig-like domain-containing protein, partial [Actinomycetota bacterium]|nr:Ig-like domain-containing protein [Actinomycetota bacterium]
MAATSRYGFRLSRLTAAFVAGLVGVATSGFLPTPAAGAPPKFFCEGEEATLVGTTGSDNLVGTNHRDIIAARGGNDEVVARDGKDLVCTGDGKDIARGGDGSDEIMGNGGADDLTGGDGADVIKGQGGNDDLGGGRGADELTGGAGTDEANGGPGIDVCSAETETSCDEAPPTDIDLSNDEVDENQPAGTAVGNLSTTDPNAGDTHTYSLVSGAGDADNSAFQIDGSILETSQVFDFEADSSKSIRIRSTDSSGLRRSEQFTITITDTPDPPVVVTTAGATSFTEGDPATTIDAGLTVTDQDDTDLEGATVSISTGFEAGDELLFSNQSGITGSYNSGTGVLTLTEPASVENYQTALRSVQYSNAGELVSSSKVVEFKANDGDADSDPATKSIDITEVNDAPTINTTSSVLSYTEGDGPVAVDTGLTVTDPDSSQLQGATVRITSNFSSGEDDLAFADQLGITGSYNDSTGTLTLSGNSSVADYQTALRSVTYENSSQAPSVSTRTVSFDATDTQGDTSNTATRDISVAATDDPPDAVNDSATVLEDAAATVVPVLSNDTDVDGGPKTISSATDPANGTVVLTGGSPGAHTGLTYQPDPNYCNDPPGTTPDTFTYTINGGDSATVSMTVTCVNDAPVADDETFGGAGEGNDQAHGNTTMQVDDPSDNKSAPTHPHTEITGDILAGDTDVDSPLSSLIVQSAGSDVGATNGQTADGGTVSIESDGDFVYFPPSSTSCD